MKKIIFPVLPIFILSFSSLAIATPVELRIPSGYKTENCSWEEQKVIKNVHDILFEAIDSRYNDLLNCMRNAPVVEFSCHKKGSPERAARLLKEYDTFTTVKCANLPVYETSKVLGQAPVSIKGNRLKLDHDYIKTSTPRNIASTVAHEIMHNRGWVHKKNYFGSTYYPNTIPEQIEACIRSYRPNASKGPKTVTWNKEFCHGPKTGNLSSRRGMHACPVGTYMAGVRLSHNEFLCSNQPGASYSEKDEIVRKKGGYSEFSMAVCPKGYAMSGLHKKKNLLLCAPFPNSARAVDYSTSRAGMHTCPQQQVMSGLHAGKNRLTCQK